MVVVVRWQVTEVEVEVEVEVSAAAARCLYRWFCRSGRQGGKVGWCLWWRGCGAMVGAGGGDGRTVVGRPRQGIAQRRAGGGQLRTLTAPAA